MASPVLTSMDYANLNPSNSSESISFMTEVCIFLVLIWHAGQPFCELIVYFFFYSKLKALRAKTVASNFVEAII